MTRIHYTHCPSCSHTGIQKITQATDHTVTNESFEIWECRNCSLRFTQDVPDAHSIGKYYLSEKYISHSDTSEGIINSLYHKVRKITIKSKKRIVEKHSGTVNGNILDVGAGTGVFAAAMKKDGWNVTALEPDENARQVALHQNHIEIFPPDKLFELPQSEFDAVTLWHVLEHVHPLHDYLNRLKHLIRRSGCIIIAVPNYPSFDESIYKNNWAAYDVPRHLYHFSPTAMGILLENHHLAVDKILPMWFDSFYVSLLSEKYKTGKNNLIRGLLNGMISNVKAFRKNEKCSSLIYIVRCK